MHKFYFPTALLAVSLSFFGLQASEASAPRETRAILEEWVRVEKSISEEKNQWAVEQSIINAEIETLEAEIALLEERIEAAQETTSAADLRRRELNEKTDLLRDQVSVIEAFVPEIEAMVKALYPKFPEPLQQSTRTFLQRLPDPGASTRLSLGQRVQLIIGTLQAVDNFSRQVNLVQGTQELPDGRISEVSTLYFGLAIAYFVNANETYAGYGIPGPDGWEWTQNNDLARRINHAIGVYNTSRLAEFISLPVIIK